MDYRKQTSFVLADDRLWYRNPVLCGRTAGGWCLRLSGPHHVLSIASHGHVEAVVRRRAEETMANLGIRLRIRPGARMAPVKLPTGTVMCYLFEVDLLDAIPASLVEFPCASLPLTGKPTLRD